MQNLCPADTLLASEACAGMLVLGTVTPSFSCTDILRNPVSNHNSVYYLCTNHPGVAPCNTSMRSGNSVDSVWLTFFFATAEYQRLKTISEDSHGQRVGRKRRFWAGAFMLQSPFWGERIDAPWAKEIHLVLHIVIATIGDTNQKWNCCYFLTMPSKTVLFEPYRDLG